MRFEVLKAVKMTLLFWAVTPGRLVEITASGKHTASIFRAEEQHRQTT
jgi:hypothetical protein